MTTFLWPFEGIFETRVVDKTFHGTKKRSLDLDDLVKGEVVRGDAGVVHLLESHDDRVADASLHGTENAR